MERSMNLLIISADYPEGRERSGLAPLFADSNFRVERALNLAQGISLLTQRPYDIVLLDLDLPDSSGLRTLRTLRLRAPEVPVVILTTENKEASARLALREGAQDFLVLEEINTRYLLRTLRYAIEKNRFELEAKRSTGHLELAVADRTAKYEETTVALKKENAVRKRKERELRRTNRLLRVVTECNQALEHAKSESELVTWICEVMVFTGGYQFAWIGALNPDQENTLIPVGEAGFKGESFKKARIVLTDTVEGSGPGITAVQSKKPCIIKNVKKDTRYADDAKKMGYSSAIGLPILIGNDLVPGGALVLLSRTVLAFDAEEKKIFGQLTEDISFGIRAMRTREAHQVAEEALHDSEMFYRTLINTLPVGIAVVDTDEQVAFLSPTGSRMLRLPAPEEGLGTPFQRWVAPDADEPPAKKMRKILKGSSRETPLEASLVRSDGTSFVAELRSALLRDTAEQVIGTLVVTQDITDRKIAEERLQKAYGELEERVKERTADLSFANKELKLENARREQLMAALQSSEQSLRTKQQLLDVAEKLAHIGSWEWDLSSGTCRWSDEQYRIFGFEPHAIKPTHKVFLSAIHSDDRSRVMEAEKAVINGEQNFDLAFRIIRPDSSIRDVYFHGEVKKNNDGKPISLAGSAQDITEQKKAEEERTRLATIVAQSDDAIIGLNPDGTVFSWNSGAEHIFGYPVAEAAGEDITAIISPRRATKIQHNISLILAGEQLRSFESLCRKKDGSHFYALLTLSPVLDENQKMFSLVLIARDTTARKKIQHALKESEEKYRTLFLTMGQAMFVTDPRGNILDTNPAADAVFGRSRVESIGMPVCHPRLRIIKPGGEEIKPEDLPWIRSINKRDDMREIIGILPADGPERYVLASAKPGYRPGEQAPYQVFVMLSDVTDIDMTSIPQKQSRKRF